MTLGGTPNAGFFLARTSNGQASLGKIVDFDSFFANAASDEERMVGFIDPSSHPTTPGWPLRNLLTLLAVRFRVNRIRVLCWKDDVANFDVHTSRSVVADVIMEEMERDDKQLVFQGSE